MITHTKFRSILALLLAYQLSLSFVSSVYLDYDQFLSQRFEPDFIKKQGVHVCFWIIIEKSVKDETYILTASYIYSIEPQLETSNVSVFASDFKTKDISDLPIVRKFDYWYPMRKQKYNYFCFSRIRLPNFSLSLSIRSNIFLIQIAYEQTAKMGLYLNEPVKNVYISLHKVFFSSDNANIEYLLYSSMYDNMHMLLPDSLLYLEPLFSTTNVQYLQDDNQKTRIGGLLRASFTVYYTESKVFVVIKDNIISAIKSLLEGDSNTFSIEMKSIGQNSNILNLESPIDSKTLSESRYVSISYSTSTETISQTVRTSSILNDSAFAYNSFSFTKNKIEDKEKILYLSFWAYKSKLTTSGSLLRLSDRDILMEAEASPKVGNTQRCAEALTPGLVFYILKLNLNGYTSLTYSCVFDNIVKTENLKSSFVSFDENLFYNVVLVNSPEVSDSDSIKAINNHFRYCTGLNSLVFLASSVALKANTLYSIKGSYSQSRVQIYNVFPIIFQRASIKYVKFSSKFYSLKFSFSSKIIQCSFILQVFDNKIKILDRTVYSSRSIATGLITVDSIVTIRAYYDDSTDSKVLLAEFLITPKDYVKFIGTDTYTLKQYKANASESNVIVSDTADCNSEDFRILVSYNTSPNISPVSTSDLDFDFKKFESSKANMYECGTNSLSYYLSSDQSYTKDPQEVVSFSQLSLDQFLPLVLNFGNIYIYYNNLSLQNQKLLDKLKTLVASEYSILSFNYEACDKLSNDQSILGLLIKFARQLLTVYLTYYNNGWALIIDNPLSINVFFDCTSNEGYSNHIDNKVILFNSDNIEEFINLKFSVVITYKLALGRAELEVNKNYYNSCSKYLLITNTQVLTVDNQSSNNVLSVFDKALYIGLPITCNALVSTSNKPVRYIDLTKVDTVTIVSEGISVKLEFEKPNFTLQQNEQTNSVIIPLYLGSNLQPIKVFFLKVNALSNSFINFAISYLAKYTNEVKLSNFDNGQCAFSFYVDSDSNSSRSLETIGNCFKVLLLFDYSVDFSRLFHAQLKIGSKQFEPFHFFLSKDPEQPSKLLLKEFDYFYHDYCTDDFLIEGINMFRLDVDFQALGIKKDCRLFAIYEDNSSKEVTSLLIYEGNSVFLNMCPVLDFQLKSYDNLRLSTVCRLEQSWSHKSLILPVKYYGDYNESLASFTLSLYVRTLRMKKKNASIFPQTIDSTEKSLVNFILDIEDGNPVDFEDLLANITVGIENPEFRILKLCFLALDSMLRKNFTKADQSKTLQIYKLISQASTTLVRFDSTKRKYSFVQLNYDSFFLAYNPIEYYYSDIGHLLFTEDNPKSLIYYKKSKYPFLTEFTDRVVLSFQNRTSDFKVQFHAAFIAHSVPMFFGYNPHKHQTNTTACNSIIQGTNTITYKCEGDYDIVFYTEYNSSTFARQTVENDSIYDIFQLFQLSSSFVLFAYIGIVFTFCLYIVYYCAKRAASSFYYFSNFTAEFNVIREIDLVDSALNINELISQIQINSIDTFVDRFFKDFSPNSKKDLRLLFTVNLKIAILSGTQVQQQIFLAAADYDDLIHSSCADYITQLRAKFGKAESKKPQNPKKALHSYIESSIKDCRVATDVRSYLSKILIDRQSRKFKDQLTTKYLIHELSTIVIKDDQTIGKHNYN